VTSLTDFGMKLVVRPIVNYQPRNWVAGSVPLLVPVSRLGDLVSVLG